jgi:TP901 family phage tail tape measure protein
MALTARELVFYIRAQNQASGAIGRVISDLMALNKATELANKQALATARVQTSGVRLSAAQRDLASVKQNVPAQQAILAAQASRAKLSDRQFASGTKELSIQRQLFDLETQRLILNDKLNQAKIPADAQAGLSDAEASHLNILQRQMESIGMQKNILTRNVKAQVLQAQQLGIAYQSALAEQRKLQAKVNFGQVNPDELEAAQAKVNMAQAQYGNAVAQSEAIAQAQRARSIEQLGRYAGAIEHVGRVAQIAGAGILAGFGVAAISAAKAQSQIVLAATQSTVAGKNSTAQVLANAQYLQKQIIKIQQSGRSTASQSDQSASAYDIFSSVSLPGSQLQQLREGTQLLKEFNTVATANYGQVSLQQVTKAGTVIMNNFHTSVAEMPAALNTMQAAVRYGSLTMGQFVSTFNTVAPAFKAAGYSFQSMAGNVAAISRYFPNIATGAVGLARLTDTFGRYSKDFQDWGVKITDVNGKLLPLNEIIQKIIDKQPGLAKGGVALQSFLKDVTGNAGTSQARKAFVTYAENLPQIDKLIKQVSGDNNELQKSFASMQKSPGVQWAEFTNQLKALVYEIGIYAIPALVQIGKPIAAAVKWFDQLSPSTQRAISRFGVFGGAALLLGGTILKIVSTGTKMITMLRILQGERAFSALSNDATLAAGSIDKAEIQAATLRSTLVGLAAKAFIITAVLEIIPKSSVGQQDLDKIGLGFLGRAPVIGALAQQSASLESSVAAKLGIGPEAYAKMPAWFKKYEAASAAQKKNISLNNLVSDTANAYADLVNSANVPADVKAQLRKNANVYTKANLNSLVALEAKYIGTAAHPAAPHTDASRLSAADRWTILFNNVKAANALVTKNPKSLADSEAAIEALNKLQKASTPTQFQAAENVLSSYTSTQKKVASTAESAAKKKITQAKELAQELKDIRTRNNSVFKIADSMTADGGPTKLLDQIKAKSKQIVQEMADASTKTQLVGINTQISALKKLEAEQKKVVDNLKSYNSEAVQDLQNVYTQFLQANQQAFGTLFQGPYMSGPQFQDMTEWGLVNQFGQATPRSSDLLKDLQSQIGQFNQFHGGLGKLSKRGLPKGLIAQIEQEGTSAVPDIQALEQMTNKQLKTYAKLWKQGQVDIQKATTIDFQPELKKWKVYGKEIAKAIAAGISEDDFTIFKNLKNEILKGLKGTVTPVGHGKHPTVHLTQKQKDEKIHTTAFHYHVHGVEDMRGARTELKHMHFRHRNSILI